MRRFFQTVVLLSLLLSGPSVDSQQHRVRRAYAYGGGHFQEYITFGDKGEFTLSRRSDEGPPCQSVDYGSIRGTFSFSADRVEFVVTGRSLPALLPAHGKIAQDGSLRITFRHSRFAKELTRVFHPLETIEY